MALRVSTATVLLHDRRGATQQWTPSVSLAFDRYGATEIMNNQDKTGPP